MTLTQLRYVIKVADTGSMNAAAKTLFVSQPSLSSAIRELEEELGLTIFFRTNRGIVLTPQGQEFIGYARQVVEQYELIESRYISKDKIKARFSVSMQHYSFAVRAFVDTVKEFGLDEFEFAVNEDRTSEVINDVAEFRSEIGVLYLSSFNEKILQRIFREQGLEFHPLFDCHIFAYMWKGHPLADKSKVTLEELDPYPMLSFNQGAYNSFYFSEEVLSTYNYKRIIKGNDRATFLNLMVGLNGYTLCSGIISEDLNGEEYCAVPLDSDEVMHIGYLTKKQAKLSEIGRHYIDHLARFKDQVIG
jgi:DNA-binding transcriptional LysR family regulator